MGESRLCSGQDEGLSHKWPCEPPKKTMNALYAHVYIVLVSFALVYAYRVYNSRGKDKDAELSPTEEDLKGEDEPSRETFYAKGVGDWG